MFDAVKQFLENAKEISEKDFEQYCVNYLKDHNPINFNTLQDSEFNELENSGDYLILYRGLHNEEYTEKMRNGEIYIGGMMSAPVRQEGHGIYTTSNLSYAKFYAQMPNSKTDCGEIVKLALKKSAKLIDLLYLDSVFNKMIETHAEYFKDYLNKIQIYGDMLYFWKNTNQKLLNILKKETGFDCLEKLKTINDFNAKGNLCNQVEEKLAKLIFGDETTKKLEQIQQEENEAKNNNNLQLAIEKDEEFTKIVNERKKILIEKHPEIIDCYDKENEYYIDKVFALKQDPGMLAALMGFDCVVSLMPMASLSDDEVEKFKNKFGDDFTVLPILDCFNIVNFENLYICSDVFEQVKPVKTFTITT